MTAPLTIDDAGGRRAVEAGAFPFAIGGAGADLRLPGADGRGVLAYLGLDRGEVFVQPADGARVRLGGVPLQASHWLRDGDLLSIGGAQLAVRREGAVIRLRVRHGVDDDERTEPPVLVPPPRAPSDVEVDSAGVTVAPVAFSPRHGAAAGGGRRWLPRPAALLIAVLLATLAGAAAFLFSARSVALTVEPAPERLSVDGHGRLVPPAIGGRHLLRPGRYTLRAEKAGFAPLEQAFEVTGDRDQAFRFTLERLPGELTLELDPAAARVLVDDRPAVAGEGAATRTLPLAAGRHRLRVEAERYLPFTTEVTIEGGGSNQALEVTLRPAWGTVRLASLPPGAAVRANGAALGTTPLDAELMAGPYTLELSLAGFKTARRHLQVTAGAAHTVPAVDLSLADATLVLDSVPPAATVAVDGVYRGETPLSVTLSPGEAHGVQLSRAGYALRRERLTLEPGERRTLRLALDAREGELAVVAIPPDAELVIDGEARGAANQRLRLSAVAHRVEVRKPGYLPFRTTVTPLPGVAQTLEVTLESEAQAASTARPPVIVTGEGHQLRLIAPGRFEMGASRREPGRRANETERRVALTRAFYLASREVSNQQLRRFLAAHRSGQAGGHNLEIDHHPAVRVTWEQAAAYCNWLSEQEQLPPVYQRRAGTLVASAPIATGYRLPTEAEWAWAARYTTADQPARKYPWGDTLPIPDGAGNFADHSARALVPTVLAGYDDRFPATAPVDSFAADGRGLYHLGGNVAEWMHDRYAVRPPGAGSLERDPLGPAEGPYHVIRGAGWRTGTVAALRLSYRDYDHQARPDVGFRVARYAE